MHAMEEPQGEQCCALMWYSYEIINNLKKIESELWQGSVISPGLHSTYSENIILCVLEKQLDGITIADRRGARLRFADDTTLLRTSKRFNKSFNKIATQGTPQMAVD